MRLQQQHQLSQQHLQQAQNLEIKSNTIVTGIATTKTKKNKKDKKNKERRDVLLDAQPGVVANVNIGPQQDERSRFSNIYGGISQPNVSEILSLSNSSMSSNFPPAANINKTNIPSDLTFAGKFKHGGILNQISSPLIGGHKNNDNNNQKPAMTTNTTIATNKGITTSSLLAAHNYSNESSSNSHISHVGGIDFQDTNNLMRTNKLNLLEQQQQQQQLLILQQQQQHDKNLLDNQQLLLQQHTQQQENQLLNIPIIATTPSTTITTTPEITTATTSANILENIIEEKKVPKKRGRKKGSKGVDCIISNDTSLSTQMLQMQSSLNSSVGGMKKVKTTKELYAEMQNRKNANYKNANNNINKLSSPAINLISRPTSSCSGNLYNYLQKII